MSVIPDYSWRPLAGLFLVAWEADAEELMRMLRQGQDIRQRDPVVRIALVNRKNVRLDPQLSTEGFTPLLYACAGGGLDVVEMLVALLRQGLTEDYSCDLASALNVAAVQGHAGIVRMLLGQRADVNAMYNNSRCSSNYPWPLQVGEEKTQGRSLSETPLHAAYRNGHDAVVDILVRNGADIYARDKSGNTAVTIAYSKNHEDIVKYFLKLRLRVASPLLSF